MYWTYYKHNHHTNSKRFEAETHLTLSQGRVYTPDAIASYLLPNQAARIFCIEVYNGMKTKYASDQLRKLFSVLDSSRVIEQKVGRTAVPRILCVCDTEQLMSHIQKRLQADSTFRVEQIEQLLFFKLDKAVWTDFGADWQNLSGDVVDLSNLKLLE